MPLVCDELRRLARRLLQGEKPDPTLQPTALVNEVYLKLADLDRVSWENPRQFFGFAARLMRHILVDHARAQRTAKRGYGATFVPLDDAAGVTVSQNLDILALHKALNSLKAFDGDQSRIVELRFFAGLSLDEIAAVTGVARITVSRRWASAKAWLYRELRAAPPAPAERLRPSPSRCCRPIGTRW